MQILIIILVILIALLLFKSCGSGKDRYTAADVKCPQYGQWPQDGKCQSWIDFLSSGYPTIYETGQQANNMMFDDGWTSICTGDQLDAISSNGYVFWNADGYPVNVDMVIQGLEGNLSKKELCQAAKVITTPPTNPCQLQDWKYNYMNTLTSDDQAKLNLWKTYGC